MSRPRLPNSVEIARDVADLRESIPVLPREGHRFGGCLTTPLAAVGSDERSPESRLIPGYELCELGLSVQVISVLPASGISDLGISGCPRTSHQYYRVCNSPDLPPGGSNPG